MERDRNKDIKSENADSELQKKKFEKMTNTPVKPLICRMAVPTILSMIVSSVYNMADTYFVGLMQDTSATAAVGVAFSLMTVIQAVGFTFGQGSGIYISGKLGEKNYKEASTMASTGFWSGIILSVVLAVFCYIFLRPLTVFLGATETCMDYASGYMKYLIFGMPFMVGSFILNNQLRLQGNASFAMAGVVTGSVLNIILDPVLIFTLEMGVEGAALATALCQMIGFLILFAGTFNRKSIHVFPSNIRPEWKYYYTIFKNGAPSFARQAIASIAAICLNRACKEYGDAAIAAMSIVGKYMFFGMALIIGFGQGFQPVCGFNHGAKKYQRVKEGYIFCIIVAAVFLILFSGTSYVFADKIVALFRKDDADVISAGVTALRWQCMTFPLFSYITMTNMLLQATGRSLKATLLAVGRQGLFFVPCLFLLEMAAGLNGIMAAQPIADVFTFVFTLVLGIPEVKKMVKNK